MTSWTYQYTRQSHSPALLAFVGDGRLLVDYQARATKTKVAMIYDQSSHEGYEATHLATSIPASPNLRALYPKLGRSQMTNSGVYFLYSGRMSWR